MKILVARMNHETNTFSPIATPLKSFGDDGPLYGADAYAASKNTRTGIAAFIDVLEAAGHEVVVACSATANPSGTVSANAYTHLSDTIVAAAQGCDAVALDLHGAMVAENSDDGEGDLLERVRAALPHAPIAVAHCVGNQPGRVDLAGLALEPDLTLPHPADDGRLPQRLEEVFIVP